MPLSSDYWRNRRRTLIRAGLCVWNATHGPALPMHTLCAACREKQQAKNARLNPLRKGRIRKVQGES